MWVDTGKKKKKKKRKNEGNTQQQLVYYEGEGVQYRRHHEEHTNALLEWNTGHESNGFRYDIHTCKNHHDRLEVKIVKKLRSLDGHQSTLIIKK